MPGICQSVSQERSSQSVPEPLTHGLGGSPEPDGWAAPRLDLGNAHFVIGLLSCSLIAVTHDGQRQTVTSWAVPPAGYGAGTRRTP